MIQDQQWKLNNRDHPTDLADHNECKKMLNAKYKIYNNLSRNKYIILHVMLQLLLLIAIYLMATYAAGISVKAMLSIMISNELNITIAAATILLILIQIVGVVYQQHRMDKIRDRFFNINSINSINSINRYTQQTAENKDVSVYIIWVLVQSAPKFGKNANMYLLLMFNVTTNSLLCLMAILHISCLIYAIILLMLLFVVLSVIHNKNDSFHSKEEAILNTNGAFTYCTNFKLG